jgi:hypothetical protein
MGRILVIAATVATLAGCGGGGGSSSSRVVSEDQAKVCFHAHGFVVADKPNLGAAAVPAEGWFSARKGDQRVAVAYFASGSAAKDAADQLVTITKNVTKTYGLKLTDQQVRNVVRTSGSVLYFWPTVKPSNLRDVQSCLGAS